MPMPKAEFPVTPVGDASFEASLKALQDEAFCNSQAWQAQQHRARTEGSCPIIIEFERLFIREMTKLHVPVFCAEGIRTKAEQADKVALGHSKLMFGPHIVGCARDIVHSKVAWGLSNRQWSVLGHVGKEVAKRNGLPVTWGGDWPHFYDPAHWEVSGWRMIADQFPFKDTWVWPK